MWGSISRPWDHDLGRNQESDTQLTELPRPPSQIHLVLRGRVGAQTWAFWLYIHSSFSRFSAVWGGVWNTALFLVLFCFLFYSLITDSVWWSCWLFLPGTSGKAPAELFSGAQEGFADSKANPLVSQMGRLRQNQGLSPGFSVSESLSARFPAPLLLSTSLTCAWD